MHVYVEVLASPTPAHMMTHPRRLLMKVGEVAKVLGATTRTLIYYEEEGLLKPKRTPKGTRVYGEHDVKRVEIAMRLSALGIPIKRIKELAGARERCETGGEASRRVVSYLSELRTEIQQKLAQLSAVERDIERADALVRQCSACTRKPSHTGCPTCPVERNLDQSSLARLIWDPQIDQPGRKPNESVHSRLRPTRR
jgi:DNA-binding transcriptional MerR regulator